MDDALLHAPRGTQLDVVIVTYNNSTQVLRLIETLLAHDTEPPLRITCVDNASTDSTVELLKRQGSINLLRRPSNQGFAAGINAAMAQLHEANSILILNPDTSLEPRALSNLWERHQQGEHIVVPRLVSPRGQTLPSLRREPSLLRTLGEAVFGDHWPHRPSYLSEIIRRPRVYQKPGIVDWATGAAMLLSAEVVESVGLWDESFFLYSEETDFCRRARRLGYRVFYEPKAVVVHEGGGSGRSPELFSLQSQSRLKYGTKWHGRTYSILLRAIVLFGHLLRSVQRSEDRFATKVLLGRTKNVWGEK